MRTRRAPRTQHGHVTQPLEMRRHKQQSSRRMACPGRGILAPQTETGRYQKSRSGTGSLQSPAGARSCTAQHSGWRLRLERCIAIAAHPRREACAFTVSSISCPLLPPQMQEGFFSSKATRVRECRSGEDGGHGRFSQGKDCPVSKRIQLLS